MIFDENCLLADNSHERSYLIFQKLGKMSQNLSSAAGVIGPLRANKAHMHHLLRWQIQPQYLEKTFTTLFVTIKRHL